MPNPLFSNPMIPNTAMHLSAPKFDMGGPFSKPDHKFDLGPVPKYEMEMQKYDMGCVPKFEPKFEAKYEPNLSMQSVQQNSPLSLTNGGAHEHPAWCRPTWAL